MRYLSEKEQAEYAKRANEKRRVKWTRCRTCDDPLDEENGRPNKSKIGWLPECRRCEREKRAKARDPERKPPVMAEGLQELLRKRW